MPHILIDGEQYNLRAKDLLEDKIRFADFTANCPKCDAKLESSGKLEDGKIACKCGQSFTVVGDPQKPKGDKNPLKEAGEPVAKNKPQNESGEPQKKTEKPKAEKPKAEKPKAEKPKAEKPKAEKDIKNRGAMTKKVAQTDRFKAREGSYNQIIGDMFKKPTVPLNIKDKILDAMKLIKDKSPAHTKDPYGYARGYVTKMIKNGFLEIIE